MLTAVAVSQAVEGPYFLNRKNRWDLGQHGNGKATFQFMIWFIIFHRSAVKCRWTQTLLPKCCREAQGVINLISSPSPSCYCVQILQGLGIPGTFTPRFLLSSILFSVEPWAAAMVSSKQKQTNKNSLVAAPNSSWGAHVSGSPGGDKKFLMCSLVRQNWGRVAWFPSETPTPRVTGLTRGWCHQGSTAKHTA